MLSFCRTLALMRRILINMDVILIKANYLDCPLIAKIQKMSFSELLEKYKDYDTNPACEDLDKIQEKFHQTFTEYYLIKVGKSIDSRDCKNCQC